MIEREVEYLDGDITCLEEEPSTFKEIMTIFGTEGAAVKECVDNVRYRNRNPRVYKKSSKELELVVPKAVKLERKLPDGSIKKIYESDIDHLRAAFRKDPDKTTEVVTKYALAEPLFVKGDRTGIGGRISSKVQNSANSYFAEGEERVEEVAEQIESIVPNYKVMRDAEGSITPESLARAIQALHRKLERDVNAKAAAVLSGAPE